MDSTYPSHDFVAALSKAAGGNNDCFYAECGGGVYRLPMDVDGKPIVTHPLIDYFEPLLREDVSDPVVPTASVPRVVVGGVCEIGTLGPQVESAVAPLIDWVRFQDWASFGEYVDARKVGIWKDSRRQVRRVQGAVGEISVSHGLPPEDAIPAVFSWKRECLGGGAKGSIYESPKFQETVCLLAKSGAVKISGLFAGSKALAYHVGIEVPGRFFYWMPAYNPEFANYSVGRILLERLLEFSFNRGDSSFEFMIGAEPYKCVYATHFRRIARVGREQWRARVGAATRKVFGRLVVGQHLWRAMGRAKF